MWRELMLGGAIGLCLGAIAIWGLVEAANHGYISIM